MLTIRAASGLLATLLVAGLGGLAAEDLTGSESYVRWKQELRQLVDSRSLDIYEFDFMPLRLEHVAMPTRSGDLHHFHYLTFRLRNKVSANAEYVEEHRSALNEVLQTIAAQYENVTYTTDGGPRLVTKVEALEDQDLATIVESEDLKVATRRCRMTAIALDENGSTFDLFIEDPAANPLDSFSFEDRGNERLGNVYRRVHHRIEEIEGMRLHSVHEIRQTQLPPFDANRFNDEGVPQGQIFGVLIFNEMPVEGDFFTIRIQGLSNKMRIREPNHSADQLADYINTTYLRRTYVMHAERRGDEFFLEEDRFKVVDSGWEWVPSFQRIRQRASIAYAEYFLENHPLAKERSGPDGPVLRNEAVEQSFWQYFGVTREQLADLYTRKDARLQKEQKRVEETYDQLQEGERLGEEELLRRRSQWLQALEQARRSFEENKSDYLDSLSKQRFEVQTEEHGGK